MPTNYPNFYLIFHLALILFLQLITVSVANIEALAIQFNSNDSTREEHMDWAFSPVHMTYLAKEENIIYTLIQKYRKALKKKISMLESYTRDYIESTKTDEVDDITNEWKQAKAISAHPLMTYRMIRRFAYNLNQIINDKASHVEKALLDKIQEMNHAFNLPTSTDLENIMDNILRIQNVYELRTKDLLRGIIANKRTGVGLTVSQAYDIGKHAISKQIYTEGLDWLQNVLFELKVNPHQDVDVEDVHDTTRQLIREHDELHDNIRPELENFYNFSMNRFARKINSNTDNLETLISLMRYYYDEDETYNSFSFLYTCIGTNIKTAAEMSKLYCYFDMKLHPVWKINPLKIEVHSWDPYVIQIYDVIGDKGIEYLRKTSLPTMSRATIVTYGEGSPVPYQISSFRTSSYSFLTDKDHEYLLSLDTKIGFMTGLKVENMHNDGTYFKMEASEPIQIAMYGFGGHFAEHVDALQDKENETLNDVESGGYTSFPAIKLAIPPVKGSAVFWYSLMKNGSADLRTMHGGCPVILGEKWIANKWIRHNANFHKRPCSLDPLK